MAVFRLKDEHPTYKKVRQLEKLAMDLGLTIQVEMGQILIIDSQEHITVQYRDAEQATSGWDTTDSFPYSFETKLTFVKD